MSNINDLSIFGDYSQKENRVTAGLLHILNTGKEPLIRFIGENIGIILPSSEIEITSQEKGDNSIPDGVLKCGFIFNIFIESKISKNAINPQQYENHKKMIKNDSDFLLYITPDINKPKNLEDECLWANWIQIIEWLKEYIKNEQILEEELLFFLIYQFEILLINYKLLPAEWNFNSNPRVLIVAGGRYGEDTAKKYKKYFCQNKRYFQPSGYIAFYHSYRIKYCFKIQKKPLDDQNLLNDSDLSSYLESKGLNKEDWVNKSKLFYLDEKVNFEEIENDKIDRNGNRCAYTQSHTYSTIEKLIDAKKTSDL